MGTRSRKPVLGLIGGIGSGKSRLAAELARRGGQVIPGDLLGHEALRQPDIKAGIVQRWGKDILDSQGEIDRRKMGQIVFADPAQRKELESRVFPFIDRRIAEEIAKGENDPRLSLIVLDAAVLLEAGWDRHCDYLVFVDAPREARLQRLAQNRGLNAKEVAARENAQMSVVEKKRRADFVLDNSASPEQLFVQVDKILKNLSGSI